ncbi:MAG: acetylpolyamine amidohydrolase [Proteobacteria bacterium]|nr:MAG: acetylpolyamine amidohydrolase [Pseudomonadota bacterium]
MISFFSSQHALHAPEYEYFRGEPVPCFESPQRVEFVKQALQAQGHELREPDQDSSPVLPQIHAAAYLEFLASAWEQWLALDANNAQIQAFPSTWPIRSFRSDKVPENFTAKLGLYSFDNGTPLMAGSWTAAKAGADAAVSAANLLADGEQGVFCATRPPGHHAGTDFMGGYCFINNAALAAQALRIHGASQVAILDVDYHHGNGTQEIFYKRSDVIFASIHADPMQEYPFYLGHADENGINQGEGFNLNLPLARGSDVEQWFVALETACQYITKLKADTLVVSLGLDTFADDPLSSFNLSSEHFKRLGERLNAMKLPTIFILEGGYASKQLGLNAAQVLAGFEQ